VKYEFLFVEGLVETSTVTISFNDMETLYSFGASSDASSFFSTLVLSSSAFFTGSSSFAGAAASSVAPPATGGASSPLTAPSFADSFFF
jgi:hypothetical protein